MDTSVLWFVLLSSMICMVISEAPPPQSLGNPSEVSGFRMLFNAYRQCSNQQDTIVCLKGRALRMLDRATQIENIQLMDGISLVKKTEVKGRSLDVEHGNVAENVVPENSEEFSKKVDSMLFDKISKFARSRSLQLTMPESLSAEGRDFDDGVYLDGRKKKKDKGGHMYMMMLKGGLLAMAYKALALLAAKALLVSKIALTLALLVAFKKLFSGGHSGSSKTTYEIVKQPVLSHPHQYGAPGAVDTFGSYSDNSAPYARSIAQPEMPYPQLAAYRAQIRAPSMTPSASSPIVTGVHHETGPRDEAL
ncbi:uncharacterized protein LOC126901431 [Daktulosphaira vitifoliae]|uniref:uncharacterized protein LOC126901431 n=1 Tax=Daktulosphaira vitifoliae TaxID=58002 RepID=UPI0021AAC851|nr:uncharacterized protein LOC126901431 [Daktulosphaira vitifoliae]